MLSQVPGHPLATSWVLVALAKTASHGVQTVPASSWPREIERIGDKGVGWVTLETQECMQVLKEVAVGTPGLPRFKDRKR